MDNKLSQKDFNLNVVKAVSAAVVRLDREVGIDKIKIISDDISTEYNHLPIETIKKALKNGAMGRYGRTFRFCVQEVCIWIDSYMKEFPEADIDNEKYTYYRWKTDGSKMARRILKEDAEQLFAGELLGGYEAVVLKSIKNKNKTWTH